MQGILAIVLVLLGDDLAWEGVQVSTTWLHVYKQVPMVIPSAASIIESLHFFDLDLQPIE